MKGGSTALHALKWSEAILLPGLTRVLFASDRGGGIADCAGTEVSPAAFCAFIEKSGRGVDREWVGGDREHSEVVERVAEDNIGTRNTDAAKGSCLCRAGRYVNEIAGDEAVDDFNFGRENAVFRDAESANAFRDDPFVGGADSPKLDIGFAKGANESGQLRKDMGAHMFGEVAGCGGAEFLLTEPSINLHHFAADASFFDRTGEIGAVAGVHPIR